jgi:DNA-binding response OmpR family regulator
LTNYIDAKQNRAYIFEGSVVMPKEKVLVVDDDSAIRFTLTEALRAWGYDPLEASTVAAALESFDAERPSAVLQDVNLPDGSGLDALLDRIQEAPAASHRDYDHG